jgi:hypothetical protein
VIWVFNLSAERESSIVFSPCGKHFWTYHDSSEEGAELAKYDVPNGPVSTRLPPRLTSRILYADPLPQYTTYFVLKDGEPCLLRYVLGSSKTHIILFHIDFNGIARWKTIASMPDGVLQSALKLAAWDVKTKEGRMDIVLTGNYCRGETGGAPVVISTWESEEWDEETTVKVVDRAAG